MVDPNLVTQFLIPGLPPGLEGGKRAHRMTATSHLDLHDQVDELVAEGKTVVDRFTITGTQQGGFMDFPATGRPIRFAGVSLFRVRAGKIVEHWDLQDGVDPDDPAGHLHASGEWLVRKPKPVLRRKTGLALRSIGP